MKALGLEPRRGQASTRSSKTRLRDEIRRGVQTIQYQVVTLHDHQRPGTVRHGVHVPERGAQNEQEKRDLAMIIEEMLRQRYQGVKNEKGVWITPAFPKLIYVLEEDNIHRGRPVLLPDRAGRQVHRQAHGARLHLRKEDAELKLSKGETEGNGDCYTCMGCRSFLTPDRSGNGYDNVANAGNYEPGKPKYYGRFNQGVVTINLPDVALSSGGDMDKFWKIFDERLELCHRALHVPPQPPEGHAVRRRAHPVAVRRAGAPEKGRDHRQAALRRLLHHLPGLRGPVRVRAST